MSRTKVIHNFAELQEKVTLTQSEYALYFGESAITVLLALNHSLSPMGFASP
jgi:hypothetical protein